MTTPETPRLRIAYFSPLPPMKSGIATYSANLLPHLTSLADLTLFADAPAEVDPTLRQQFEVRDIDSFAGLWAENFDICLYQMGNNTTYHEKIYITLHRFPGITMLHDVNMHSFWGEIFLKRGQSAAYTREMGFSYGRAGINHARQARLGIHPHNIHEYPLFERIVQTSLGVAVHSQFAREMIHGRCPQIPTMHIPHLQASLLPQLLPSNVAKQKLGLAQESTLLASFGHLAPSKRIDVALRAFANLSPQFPQAIYALVGATIEGYNLQSLITELHLENKVKLVGYADENTFETYLAATDMGINLRYPSLGETSGTLMRLMGAAKPVLVSNVDAFVELPDDACIKIEVDDQEEVQIETALRTLITNADQRQQLSRQAHAYIQQTCQPDVVADQYVRFIRQLLASG